MAKKDGYVLTVEDLADILADVLAKCREAGLLVGAKKAEANGSRPDGILLFVGGLDLDAEGSLVPRMSEKPAVKEPTPELAKQ